MCQLDVPEFQRPEAGGLMPLALEKQLGLKLERGTGLIDVVVVDQAQRPDAN